MNDGMGMRRLIKYTHGSSLGTALKCRRIGPGRILNCSKNRIQHPCNFSKICF